MSVSLKIAIRFLKSSKGQTILIALGIAIGISVQIFIGSLIQGLQKSLVNTTIGNSSQITVLADTDDKLIQDYEKLIDSVRNADARITKISPVLDQAGLVIRDERTESILIRGFDFAEADKIYDIKNRLVEGQLPEQENEATIGKGLQDELELKLGDLIEITVNNGVKLEYKIVGVVDLKVAQINKTWFLTTLASAQERLEKSGTVSSIEMQVDSSNVFLADEIATGLQSLDKDGLLLINNWKDQNEQLLSGLNGQSVSSTMIQVFVVISVVLGIASVLAISVLQKSKQIGILKAMGIKSKQASMIFLYQGLILGMLGGVLGLLIGFGLAYSFTVFAVNPDGTPVVALFLDPKFFALSFGIAVVASSLASLIPARKSARLDPIEVIRNG